jgi:[protein-PII] uridylyltransferase
MQLETIIYEDGNDFEISQKLKNDIKSYLSTLELEDSSGKAFFVNHTKKMDYIISNVFKYVLKKEFGYYRPNINSLPIAIIAMGSYGREQLSIYSDIDIMIAYNPISGYNIVQIIETFITMLWDVGLKIGHRVHTINDIFDVSQEDITIKTALMESRFIYGSKHLMTEVENELEKVRKHKQKEFILAKYEEMIQRHKSNPIAMQPDIKNGKGGFRDSNTLFWIANSLFNVSNNRDLIGELFDEKEYKVYRESLEFLFKVRIVLHTLSKKKIEKVLMDYHREMALTLGFKDQNDKLAQTSFIKKLLQSLWNIYTFTNIYIKILVNPFLDEEKKELEKGYYIKDDKIYVDFDLKESFKKSLKTLIKYDYKDFDISVVNLLKNAEYEDDCELIEHMFEKENLTPLLKALYESNKLSKIIPAFKKIEHLAQFDGYHQYPVDIHSIQSVYFLENIENKFIQETLDSLSKEDKRLLKIVTLFHDLGKGRVSDHHIIGQTLIKQFLEKLDYDKNDINKAAKLIKYHTTMSIISQREDIYNDKVILLFANIVENINFLDMLYILTYADVNGVGNGVYNNFKNNLLYSLYKNTLKALDKPEQLNEIAVRKRVEDRLLKNIEFSSFPKMWQKKVLESPSNQLFLQNSTTKIINLAKKIISTDKFNIEIETKPYLKIEIIKKDSESFNMSWLLGKLNRLNVNHISIYKIFDFKYFKIEFNEKIDASEEEWLYEDIKNAFNSNKKAYYQRPVFKKNEFLIDCEHSQNYISMKLQTNDKNGIIARIVEVFDEFNIHIEDIKATIQKNKARDIFIINKDSNFCNFQNDILNKLTKKGE